MVALRLATHCQYGHEFTEANTGLIKVGKQAGKRYCKQCEHARARRYREMRKALKTRG